MNKTDTRQRIQKYMPAAEKVAEELGKAESIDDFFGKEGIFSRLFAGTIEKMVEAELTDHLGYQKHDPAGDNSGNSRNGSYRRNLRTSAGDTPIDIVRDRSGEFKPKLLKKYETSSNEIEDKITAMCQAPIIGHKSGGREEEIRYASSRPFGDILPNFSWCQLVL